MKNYKPYDSESDATTYEDPKSAAMDAAMEAARLAYGWEGIVATLNCTGAAGQTIHYEAYIGVYDVNEHTTKGCKVPIRVLEV